MSGLGRKLANERDLWRAVWQHVDAFLDRIESAQGNDKDYATTMCALLPVFGVIEGARQRSKGVSLRPALPAAVQGVKPNGTIVNTVSNGDLENAKDRVPGTEVCEYACAPYHLVQNDDGTYDEIPDNPPIILERTVTLAQFRDIKHGEVTLRTPTYEVGTLDLAQFAWKAIKISDGLFDKQARLDATDGNAKDEGGNPVPANFHAWSTVRQMRLDQAATNPDAKALSSVVLQWDLSKITAVDVQSVVATARAYAAQASPDIATLNGSKQSLTDAGVDDAVLGAIAAAVQSMSEQSAKYTAAADAMQGHGVPSYTTQLQWAALLEKAEGTLAFPSGLPTAIDALDREAVKVMNLAVETRIGYPDGPLRQLRMLQWTLRFFWDHRRRWMAWRHARILKPLYVAYMTSFTQSLQRVLNGQGSGILHPGNQAGAAGVPLPGNTKAGAKILVGATEVPLSSLPDLSQLQAGRIAILLGDRPTAAVAVDGLYDPKKLPPARLKVPPLAVSVETGKGLPGTPGLIAVGTPIADHYRALHTEELLRGAHEPGLPGDGKPARAKDAIVTSLIAHWSRLALVLGEHGGEDRPAPPALVRPYATISTFPLEGDVTAQDNRLFLKSLPAKSKSGTGEQLAIAAPGEYLLLTGTDPDGETWQTAIEVDRVVVVTGAEAKKDDGKGATPTPTCCADDEPVMVVYLRSCYLPGDVATLSNAHLHRNFQGFGPRGLLSHVMLPFDLDKTTGSAGARRDPELEVAWRVFDAWMPKEPK